MKKALLIGLTGQTGAGKSTVSQKLAKLDFYIIDGDAIARLVTTKGSPILPVLAQAFGEDILTETGELDRTLLAQRAFASAQGTKRLNAITHPEISRLIKKKITGAFFDGYDKVVVDAAALFESGFDRECNMVLSVVADEAIRLQRIMERDHLEESAARTRMQAQLEEAQFRDRCDFVIVNNGDLSALDTQIQELLDLIEGRQDG